MSDLWDQLGFLFDTDHGSLPSIWVNGLGREGVAAAYAFIRSRSRSKPDSAFWYDALDREELLDTRPDAALLVADGQATPFCFPAPGVACGGVVLPWIGIYIWPDEVELFYRMGPEWDEQRLLALFELLRRLAALSPNARVTLEPSVLADVERRFQATFSTYCRERLPLGIARLSLAAGSPGREQGWRECTDPNAMLALLGGGACPRRLRLFAAACCRRVWHLLEESAFRGAIEVAERFADGLAPEEELNAARQATWDLEKFEGLSNDPLGNARSWAACVATPICLGAFDVECASAIADGAARAVSWASGLDSGTAFDRERVVQCDLLRCVFGSTLGVLPAVADAWLAFGGGVVPKLARAIYESRRFEELPVLADALEESACGDENLLAHLRGPGPHARGCHALDLLTGGADR